MADSIHQKFLTQRHLAEALDISERTLERWRVEGGGPKFVKAGRKVLYRAEDVEEWLLASRRRSTSDTAAPAPVPANDTSKTRRAA